MMGNKAAQNARVLISIYSSSFVYSMIAVSVVACLELFMLAYTILNAGFYMEYLWVYRSFYIVLLSTAIVYIILSIYARGDIGRRYKCFDYANPMYALLFFIWSLVVTYHDFTVTGSVDTTVFMTFSLVIPLGFYVQPLAYGVIAALTDAAMMFLIARGPGGIGQMLNTGIFIIFQLVLGVSFLLLKTRLAERIVQEQENADVDVLTGCGNRRAYVREMEALAGEEKQRTLSYLAVDINGLKEVNDSAGHEMGDKLIVGAARCIEECFGRKGKVFRIGGDEFAVLTTEEAPEPLFAAFEKRMQAWSEKNRIPLTASYGCAGYADHPEADIAELARLADNLMLQAKTAYYQQEGKERRRP